jgi:predicted RNA-binding protein YlxR (DUF448 family)
MERSSKISKPRHRPIRTCIACGLKTDRDGLVRLVRTPDGGVTPDWGRKLSGRGAHICLSRRCLDTAISRRLISRAFKAEVSRPALASLETALDQGLAKRKAETWNKALKNAF